MLKGSVVRVLRSAQKAALRQTMALGCKCILSIMSHCKNMLKKKEKKKIKEIHPIRNKAISSNTKSTSLKDKAHS